MFDKTIFESLYTPRFTLYKLTPDNYQEFLKNATDKQLVEFLGIEPEEILAERKKAEHGFRTYNKSYLMFIITDTQSNRAIGHCGYHTWYLEHDRAEIGYALYNNSYKAKGVMSEVLTRVLDYGFEKMNLQRVEAFIGPNNEASLRLIEKFGFVQEGQLRNHFFKNGKWEDSIVYSKLKTEYKPLSESETL
ncbi:GNAT family N-acetyltransferase [Myroides albus]|uniref:GNAT family N-acetyltransferase n=1 Tax=Myroides albus TaxID=2562892 RepID=UPI00215940F9|nr:GNAT family protein [Myroides albus]UVD79024.1 GNAT family N-acetyltransferase [Myroides albus]